MKTEDKDPKTAVEILLDLAVNALDSGDAMRYAQAACNAANALACVSTTAQVR